MGIAAYNRGSQVIRRQTAATERPIEFEIMDRLNSVVKESGCGTPFTDVRLSASHGGWWVLCPKTGFGYWYSSLHVAVSRWNIMVIGYDNGDWIAEPRVNSNS